jgi:transcriptional regulator with XRE-family HTH domain
MTRDADAPARDFGQYLEVLLERYGWNQRRLELASGVSAPNLGHMRRGTRGAPRGETVYRIADAMDLTRVERITLFERAIGDALLRTLSDYIGFLYLAMAEESGRIEQALAVVNGLIDPPVDEDEARDALYTVAKDPELAAERRRLAAELFDSLSLRPGNREVRAMLTGLAASWLDGRPLDDPQAGVSADAAEPNGGSGASRP